MVGLGLFQGVEFLFQKSLWEIVGKAMIALRRMAATIRLIRRSAVYRLDLGRDSEENARVVRELLEQAAGRLRAP